MSDVTERHKRNCLFIDLFARLMKGEMAANAAKGDWLDMKPMELVYELSHHQAKLIKAMEQLSQLPHLEQSALDYLEARQRVLEHAADLGNIAMFIAVIIGRMVDDYPLLPEHQPSDSLSSLLIEAEQALTLVTQMHWRHQEPPTSQKHQAIQHVAAVLANDSVTSLLPRIQARLAGLLEQQAAARSAANFDDERNPENINVPSH